MATGTVLALHAHTLSIDRISCEQLVCRGVHMARGLGYSPYGIERGSRAAQGMSIEARRHGGGVPKMTHGGITASLQSIGSTGVIKPEAHNSIAAALRDQGYLEDGAYLLAPGDASPLVIVQLPYYFKSPTPEIPLLIDDYRAGGYNYRMAEQMLNESFHRDDRTGQRCACSLPALSTLTLRKLQRIENKQAFERFKVYETGVADRLSRLGADSQGSARARDSLDRRHGWLTRLADKNDLSRVSNTVYLLHGTKPGNVAQICREGLRTPWSLEEREIDGVYGSGIYLTDSSCKAYKYTSDGGCILVCRVVLGSIELLATEGNRMSPSDGYDSCHAMGGHTWSGRSPSGFQVHNEFVVYNNSACYPEFVITCEAA